MVKAINCGAYFSQERVDNMVKKTLVKKNQGSLSPEINDFIFKIESLQKYLGENVVETKIIQNGENLQLEQPFVDGEGIFSYINDKTPKKFYEFVKKLEKFYFETGMLPDLLDDRNILVTVGGEIKIVDVWPLFFRERVDDGDLNEQSYKENLEKFQFLKIKTGFNTQAEITFNKLPVGIYTEKIWRTQWPNVTKPRGVAEGRLSIMNLDGENVLCVTCLKNQVGPDAGGTSWGSRFEKTYEEATVEYKVRVENDFNFKRGGKLPGFCGGSGPMGGRNTPGGFSARIMWRELGMMTQYVYFDDKDSEKSYGQDFIWTKTMNKQVPITSEMYRQWNTLKAYDKERVYLTTNVWHTIKTYIKMNTPDKIDGKIISWFDGEEVCDLTLKLRKDDSFGIDMFKFAVFFGGNESSWAPDKDEKIYFKDFKFTLE